MTTTRITCELGATSTGTLSHWLNTSVLSDSSTLITSHVSHPLNMPSTRRRMAWLSWLWPSSRLAISRQRRRFAIDVPCQRNIKLFRRNSVL